MEKVIIYFFSIVLFFSYFFFYYKIYRVNKNATSKFKKVENSNYAVNIGKEMGLSLVNIGGVDIVDKVKKLILAIIWQLMRK